MMPEKEAQLDRQRELMVPVIKESSLRSHLQENLENLQIKISMHQFHPRFIKKTGLKFEGKFLKVIKE